MTPVSASYCSSQSLLNSPSHVRPWCLTLCMTTLVSAVVKSLSIPMCREGNLPVHPEPTGRHRGEQRFVANEERRMKDLVPPLHKVPRRLPISLLVGMSYERFHGSSKCSCSGHSCQSSLGSTPRLLLCSVIARSCTQREMNPWCPLSTLSISSCNKAQLVRPSC